MRDPQKIRNIAIIAHIDHGKTTMIDSLLAQSNIFRENEEVVERVMDHFDLEKERGITIFAKHTGILYKDFAINLIDTPGHADFSAEVERVLGMVNSVLLLVDAQEGPMPQTRFVLSQALKQGLKPIVVLNKIDRPHAAPDEALNKTFDLFVELGANDEQLDFPYCYASGLGGFAIRHLNDERKDMNPLFDLIIEKVAPPPGDLSLPFLMQVASLSYNDFLGRQATGRVLEGSVKAGDTITRIDHTGHPTKHKIAKVEGYLGIRRIDLDSGGAGDIISISGIEEVMIGDTLCSSNHIRQLPPISLGEPTLSVDFSVNDSPFCGKDGKHVTMNKLRDRLLKEKKANVSLRIEESEDDVIRVYGRGELHLSVLIETMRREGYEFSIGKPKVVIKEENGEKLEPYERTHVEVPEAFSGPVIEELSKRKGEMKNLFKNEHNITMIEFIIPTRSLMGYRNEFLNVTKGKGILTSVFDHFGPFKGELPGRKYGAFISNSQEKSTAYAIFNLQERGVIFIGPGVDVYEGMIVGRNSRDNDLVVNITREKHLTNVRASGSDENLILIPPETMDLEKAMQFIEDDEMIEVTPHFVRIRKGILKETDRKRSRSNA